MAKNYTRTNPVLADALFAEMQEALSNGLDWLDTTYGKSERMLRIIEGKRYYDPVWYKGRGDYVSLIPSAVHNGSYSFFALNEPQRTEFDTWGKTKVTMPFSLIMWVDVRKADGNDEYNTEAVKDEVLRVLNASRPTAGSFKISGIYERAERVWADYIIDESENQMNVYPFASFRFVGELQVNTICE